jgi:glycosyltransferase involved in cell wall biosynthesis
MKTSHSVLSKSANNPLITIAVPTFNRAAWLKGCIGAALAQSYQHFEVVVSDNASTDETAEVLKTFCDQRLRVVRQERNIGPAPNWNVCLAEARGDYIVFVSDDDRIAPWMLERCVTLVRNTPQIPIVIALGDVYLAAASRALPEVASRKLGTGIWDGADILQEWLKGQISAHTCTVMMRTEVLRVRGGFPMDWPHTMDLACWVPLLLTGKAGLINERCGTYCVHNATQTSNFAIDVRLKDLRKLADLIINIADHAVEDTRKRREIAVQVRRYLARHTMGLIALSRREGAKLTEALLMIWQSRRDLIHLGMGNICSTISPITLLLLFLPAPVTCFLRGIIRRLRPLRLPNSEQQKEYQHICQELSD